MGVSEPALRRWVKLSLESDDSAAKRIADLEAQNKKLKKELEDTKDTVVATYWKFPGAGTMTGWTGHHQSVLVSMQKSQMRSKLSIKNSLCTA